MIGFGALGELALGEIQLSPPDGWRGQAPDILIPVPSRTAAAVIISLVFNQSPIPPRVLDPNLTGYLEQPVVFSKPFPASQQKFSNEFIQPRAADPPNAKVNWQTLNPEVFKPPFPATSQQYDAHPPQGIISTAPTAHGWEGQQYDYLFATPRSVDGKAPFMPTLQQFATFLRPIPITATPGWEGLRYDYAFAKPFPVHEQQFFPAFEPEGAIRSTFLDGWRGLQWEIRFKPPFPAASQQHEFHPPQGLIPSAAHKEGWEGWQLEARFASPYPAARQDFLAWSLVRPPTPIELQPPGSGKRKNFPSPEIAQPPYAVKPNKPYRPVWDKPRDGEVEQHPQAPLPPAGLFTPTPPPAHMFAPRPTTPPSPLALPDFKQFAPSNPMGLDTHMRDVQDQADIMAVLKSMGIVKGEG